MKGEISVFLILMAGLIALPSAIAADGYISRLNASCDATGNAQVSMMHNGGAIKISNMALKYYYPQTNASKEITGTWVQEGQPNPVYLAEEYTKSVFTATGSPFNKKGDYEIHFLFMQAKTDLAPTDVSAAVYCPGMQCSSALDCDSDAQCSDGVCMPLICNPDEYVEFNRCVSKCDDKNPCTIDAYENSECRHYINMSSCCTKDADCSLGKTCSIDKCVNNTCEHKPVLCDAGTDRCINALCIEPKGCTYQTDETCLANENERRDYLIVVGQPTVYKQSAFSGFFQLIIDFFRSLF